MLRVLVLSIVLLTTLLATACQHVGVRTARKRFTVDFDCDSTKGKRVAGQTVRVTGCGKTALYTCAGNTCVRERTDSEWNAMAASSGGYVAAPAPDAHGVVRRSFDEAQGMHIVHGKFWMGGLVELHLTGAPKRDLTAIHAQLVRRGVYKAPEGCERMRVRVSEQPFDGRDFKVDWQQGKRAFVANATYDFEIFKPLARAHSTLAIEACGQSFAAIAQQMPKILEFFEIFSQIATDVQAEGSAPQGAPTGSGVSM